MISFEIIKHQIGNSEINSVNARDLHQRLEVKSNFSTWINNRIRKYHFIENIDFIIISKNVETTNSINGKGGTVVKEYILTMDMAKELAMVENNENGREIRRYFIEVENQFREIQIKPEINLPKTIQDSKDILELIHLFENESPINLIKLDRFMKRSQNFSPLKLLEMDFSNSYFIPTELGNILGETPAETNIILGKKGFQVRENGVWKVTEKGEPFSISFQNGSYFQIKWKLESLV